MATNEKVKLFEDVWDATMNDGYMWIVIWGPPRSSKTTLAGWILYDLYRDWYKVLNAFVYNLSQCLHKIKCGEPERWLTRNKLHNRVPGLNWDDFGAYSNKAATQHDEAWDYFKGGFDILGTKIAVLIATMVDPLEPTFQIQNKYTHELEVFDKGYYKYDKVIWKQDFRGWKPRTKKHLIEENTFDPWPDWVYREYDEVRQELADEVFQKIEDAISTSGLENVLKLCKPLDWQIMQTIVDKGPIYYKELTDLGASTREAIVRLKARQLIVPVQQSKNYYKYDLTRLGIDVLDAHKKAESLEKEELMGKS
jgi:hypothetical protein